MKALVTGATGIVGSEVCRQLRAAGCEVVGTSARGDSSEHILAWQMDRSEPPAELRQKWDVVIHAAASTRWSMTEERAVACNVATAQAVASVADDATRLVFLSTAHVEGLAGSIDSTLLADYRNTYEWSKAAAERFVRSWRPEASIVRFPIVIGRRSDGAIVRFSGFYKLMGALTSGLVPAIVATPDAYLDLAPVDDVANVITRIARQGGPSASSPVIIGSGGDAPRVEQVLEVFYDTIDAWRRDRGISPLARPPVLAPDKWERFFLPFAREHLSPLQLRTIEVFGEFQPYMSLARPFNTTWLIEGVTAALEQAVATWANAKPAAAGATPEPWR